MNHNCQISFVFGVYFIFCMVSFTRMVRIAGAGFGVLHANQLIGHAARLLYLFSHLLFVCYARYSVAASSVI